MPLAAVLLLTVEGAASPYPAAGAGFTVDSTADAVDAEPGDGVCATEAGDCTLRAAVQETNALTGPDEITLAAGTYALTIPGRAEDAAATGDLDITDDLTITGAGRDTAIIDGGQLDRIFHAFLFFHNQLQVNLSDLTIRNGKAELVPTIELGDGGGLFLGDGVSAMLADVKVTANSSTQRGGGMWIDSPFATVPPSSVDLLRVEVSGNFSNGNAGGGIYTFGRTTLTDSLVSSNSAGTGAGGGIYNEGNLTVTRSRIASNDAGNRAGISNSGTSSLTMSDSQVTQNHSFTSGGGLGVAGTVAITASTISDNAADQEGGGLFVDDGSIIVRNTTMSGNMAGTDGGGVYVRTLEGPGPALTNSTISGNEAARDGGAIFLLVGTVELTNTTVAYNEAASGGAVAYSGAPVVRDVRTSNTIVSNNTEPNCAEPLTSLGHNLEDANSCGLLGAGDLTNADPLLLPLGDYGGSTLTHALPAVNYPGDAIGPISPAIDSGDDSACPSADQRGQPRPIDGDGNGSADCDMGAYEAPEGFVCGCLPTPEATPMPTSTPGPIALPKTGGRP